MSTSNSNRAERGLRRRAGAIVGGIVLSVAAMTGFASSAAADARIVTIQQVNTGRYMDAWESDAYDWRLVTRPWQNNDTQRWEIRSVGSSNIYTIQQVSNDRYVDAHENAANDWNMVTRTNQNNDTQKWEFIDLGAGVYVIKQVSSGRYVDAWESDAYDWRMVTWTAQGNTSQQWRVTTIQVLPEILIPVFPFPLPPIFPLPPAPVVHSAGSFNLAPLERVNLDNGIVGNAGADLASQAVNIFDLQLAAVGGATMSFTDGSQRGHAGCSAAVYSASAVNFFSFSTGDYFCMRTGDGRISEVRVDSIAPILRIFGMSYTTWQP